MPNTNIRYLGAAFVEASSLNLNPQDILELLPALGARLGNIQLVSNIINEQTPAGSSPRYAFFSTDGAWQILLLSGRFDVARVTGDPIQGSNLGDYSIFCQQASDVLSTLLDHFHMQAYRLAAVQEGLLREMSDDEMAIIARKLMLFPTTYAGQRLTEWDWRAVTEINRQFAGTAELVNTIAIVKRVAGIAIQLGQAAPTLIPTKRIRLDFDINTLIANTSPRFNREQITAYFTQAATWHRQLSSEFRTLIGEGS